MFNQNAAEVYGTLKVNLRSNWTQIQVPAALFPIKKLVNFFLTEPEWVSSALWATI